MNKILLLTIGLLLAFSCKRRPGQVPTHGNIEWNDSEISASVSEHLDESTSFETPVFEKNTEPQETKSPKRIKKKITRPIVFPEMKSMKQATRKELPEGLSNALWMMIIGLGGLVLSVVIMLFFEPPMFLVFIFGLIFVVGLVSFIMYKATHKKKIKS